MRLIALLLLASTVHASPLLVSSGGSFGPNSITLDYDSRLVWLDVNKTGNMSWNQVNIDMFPGKPLYGWRRATQPEIERVIAVADEQMGMRQAIRFLGETGVDSIDSTGVEGQYSVGSLLWTYDLRSFEVPDGNVQLKFSNEMPDVIVSSMWFGTWLVKDMFTLASVEKEIAPIDVPIQVPEPQRQAFVLSVLLTMTLRRHRHPIEDTDREKPRTTRDSARKRKSPSTSRSEAGK